VQVLSGPPFMENKSLQFAIGEIQKQARQELIDKIKALVTNDKDGQITAQSIVYKFENGEI
jgi:hypothetical protein